MIIALAASVWLAAGLALGVRYAWHSGNWEELTYWDQFAFLFLAALFALPVTAFAIATMLVMLATGSIVSLRKRKGE